MSRPQGLFLAPGCLDFYSSRRSQPPAAVKDGDPVLLQQAGDSLSQLAEDWGVTVEAVIEASGRSPGQPLLIGDVLVIPQ